MPQPLEPIARLAIEEFDLDRIASGTKERLWLECFSGLTGPVALPALVVKGAGSGPTLLVTAGVHGNEFEGMEAIRRFFEGLSPGEMRGAFVGLPVCNPLAYCGMSRVTPAFVDGINLARTFPGRADGLPTERLAHALFTFATRLLGAEDLFVDLHSGSHECEYAPMVGYRAVDNPARALSERAARHFGIGRLWELPPGAVTFNGAVAGAGIPTVGTEVTGLGGLRPEDVALYERGLLSLARLWGILPGEPEPAVTGPARRTTQVIAAGSGLFRSAVQRIGERVEAGERLGDIVDPFGRAVAEVVAPAAGEVWALRRFGTAWAGDYVALIAVD